jgi:hypothetical protein
VERGEIDRLMLLLPPRHGKSELASKRYPAWLLGRNPGRQFISVSATAELASDFGRDVRNQNYGILRRVYIGLNIQRAMHNLSHGVGIYSDDDG